MMMAKQQRSERTVERLVGAAAEEFAANGFAKATLADVSRSAGVTKGALFFHFATKDELAEAVQLRGQDLLETAVEERREAEPSCLQVLIDVTHHLNALLREDPFIRAGVRITRERTNGKPQPLDFYPLWLGRLGRLLEHARRNGELGRSVADVSAHTLVTAAVSGLEALAWMGVGRSEAEKWLSHLWELVLPLLISEDSDVKIRTGAPVE
ncbi:ScbR family autoregulator-binding transcription factor [Streptomyces sp. LHD-70]|uniref:ScbR family autoregulator-binding transcription factor n=1 Tax=Streptomyces sp. LHD-70 TaxID=3072140 RepID=UPI00280E13AF|nr:ScbR family autoregulator-binding transcription factor [Streptomyces sp. LHD-70]MDQ8706878.1 ScbR family autoregulator-binding transcription factor [Streptomyces sp. LHD-70]